MSLIPHLTTGLEAGLLIGLTKKLNNINIIKEVIGVNEVKENNEQKRCDQ